MCMSEITREREREGERETRDGEEEKTELIRMRMHEHGKKNHTKTTIPITCTHDTTHLGGQRVDLGGHRLDNVRVGVVHVVVLIRIRLHVEQPVRAVRRTPQRRRRRPRRVHLRLRNPHDTPHGATGAGAHLHEGLARGGFGGGKRVPGVVGDANHELPVAHAVRRLGARAGPVDAVAGAGVDVEEELGARGGRVRGDRVPDVDAVGGEPVLVLAPAQVPQGGYRGGRRRGG